MVQVEGPSYKLILKKEKAHDMDINCVRWCPQVISENYQQIVSIYLDDGQFLRSSNKIVDLLSWFNEFHLLLPCVFASTSIHNGSLVLGRSTYLLKQISRTRGYWHLQATMAQ
jgi:hypothetical protein